MKPAPFEYLSASSLDEVLDSLSARGPEAKLLAGGQSLVPAMNFRLLQPAVLIDINGVPGLDNVRRVDGELRLGALVRHRTLEHDPLVAGLSPLIHETMPFVAHPQIRNRGTLGGSLAHADPAAELPVVALALDARFRLLSARGERWVHASDFFLGLFTTALAGDEVLVEVAVPALPSRTGTAFLELARRRGDYAMMGVAAVASLDSQGTCSHARLVYLNAGEGPVDARRAAGVLVGEAPSAAAIDAAAALAAGEEIDPMGSVHASPEYQRHLARVLTRRALVLSIERAKAT